MKSLTFLFVFLFLGLSALGQMVDVQTVQPGGLFGIRSTESLCGVAVSVPLGDNVSVARTVPLPRQLGLCRVRFVQTNVGEQLAELAQAWTLGLMSSVFGRSGTGSTLINGVVPRNLRPGLATMYVDKLAEVADEHGNITVSVVGVRSYQVNVGSEISPAPRLTNECEENCVPTGIVVSGEFPSRLFLVGKIVWIE